MTIALGILCADGIVLCADSQETLTFSKVNRPKVFELKTSHEGVKVVLAGAGDGVFLDALKDKIESALALAEPEIESVRLEVESTVAGYCEKIWSIYGHARDKPDAQMLVGIRAPDGLMLLHCDGPKVRRVPDYESIGFGGDFSTYHLKNLITPGMPMAEACPVAVHVLELVKDNVDYCGGPSRVYVLTQAGAVEEKEHEYLYIAELAFKRAAHFGNRITAKAASLIRGDIESAWAMEDFWEDAWPRLQGLIEDTETEMDCIISDCRDTWSHKPSVAERLAEAQKQIEEETFVGQPKPRRSRPEESEPIPSSDADPDGDLPF